MLFERIRIFRFDAVRWICRGGGRVGGLGATGYRYPLGSMVLLIRCVRDRYRSKAMKEEDAAHIITQFFFWEVVGPF